MVHFCEWKFVNETLVEEIRNNCTNRAVKYVENITKEGRFDDV